MQMGHNLNLLVNLVAFTKSILVAYFENSVNAQLCDTLPDTGCDMKYAACLPCDRSNIYLKT